MLILNVAAIPVCLHFIYFSIANECVHTGHQIVDVITLHFFIVDDTGKLARTNPAGNNFLDLDVIVHIVAEHGQYRKDRIAFGRIQPLHIHVQFNHICFKFVDRMNNLNDIFRSRIAFTASFAGRDKADTNIRIVFPHRQLHIVRKLCINIAFQP